MKTRENNQTNYELACKEFFQRYQSFLFQVCRAACYNFDSGAELAADIFQNTMIKVCKNPDKFKLKTEGDNTNIAGQLKNLLIVILVLFLVYLHQKFGLNRHLINKGCHFLPKK